jgi:hypothetical protein
MRFLSAAFLIFLLETEIKTRWSGVVAAGAGKYLARSGNEKIDFPSLKIWEINFFSFNRTDLGNRKFMLFSDLKRFSQNL